MYVCNYVWYKKGRYLGGMNLRKWGMVFWGKKFVRISVHVRLTHLHHCRTLLSLFYGYRCLPTFYSLPYVCPR